jgi:hypothetical protein
MRENRLRVQSLTEYMLSNMILDLVHPRVITWQTRSNPILNSRRQMNTHPQESCRDAVEGCRSQHLECRVVCLAVVFSVQLISTEPTRIYDATYTNVSATFG